MNTPFFITGLPRSRTAWLSVLFTTEHFTCLHEGIRLCDDFDSYLKMMHGYGAEGDSSSALIAIADKVIQEFPDSNWLIIQRFPNECAASAARVLNIDLQQALAMAYSDRKKLDAICPKNVMRIRYEQLDDEETVRNAWEFLLPGVPFNALRYKMLNELRIEPIITKRDYTKGGMKCLQSG